VPKPKYDGGLTKLIIFKEKEMLNKGKYIRKVLIPTIKDIKQRKVATNDLTTTKLFKNLNQWKWQQDGATSHTADNVQKWLINNVKDFVSKNEWPGNSPDMNPIENLWSIMEAKVYENGHFDSYEELILKIQDVWNNISVETLQKLSRSMKKRLQFIQKTPDRKVAY
jgi:transposase